MCPTNGRHIQLIKHTIKDEKSISYSICFFGDQ